MTERYAHLRDDKLKNASNLMSELIKREKYSVWILARGEISEKTMTFQLCVLILRYP